MLPSVYSVPLIALKRFPWVLLTSLLNGLLTITAVFFPSQDLWPFISTLTLAIPVTFGLSLYREMNPGSPRRDFGLVMTGLILIAGTYLLLFWGDIGKSTVRFFQLFLIFHLLVAVIPTLRSNLDGFWEFNKMLFIRISHALFYSTILSLGLSAAILCGRFLVGFEFDAYRIVSVIWIMVSFVFNTWFFLSGIARPAVGQTIHSYPKGLRIFSVFILSPLALVFFGILALYLVRTGSTLKIEGPSILSWLTIAVTLLFIFSHLLWYPRRKEKNTLRYFVTGVYAILLVPILLALSLTFQIARSNGIDYQTYFSFVLLVWCALVCFYFLVTRNQNIRIIPASLALVTALTVVGPISPVNLARAHFLPQEFTFAAKNYDHDEINFENLDAARIGFQYAEWRPEDFLKFKLGERNYEGIYLNAQNSVQIRERESKKILAEFPLEPMLKKLSATRFDGLYSQKIDNNLMEAFFENENVKAKLTFYDVHVRQPGLIPKVINLWGDLKIQLKR